MLISSNTEATAALSCPDWALGSWNLCLGSKITSDPDNFLLYYYLSLLCLLKIKCELGLHIVFNIIKKQLT